MRLRYCLTISAVILSSVGPAGADAVYDAHTQVELVSGRSVIRPGEPFQAAVRMKMDPGWHVYWQNSGDSGPPVSVQWKLPPGFQNGEIRWPMPERLQEAGLTTYGYPQGVLLISDILPPAGTEEGNATLKADVRWIACERICVPGRADILLNLPVGAMAGASPWQMEFNETRRQWPQPNPWAVTASQDKDFIYFEAAVPAAESAAISAVEFYPFRNDIIAHSGDQVLQKTPQGFILSVLKSNLLTKPVDSAAGIFVVKKIPPGKEAFVVDVARVPVRKAVRATASAAPAAVVSGISLLWACVFAFIGGLILNLMPCVLPVLSIKVLSLVEHAGERARAIASGGSLAVGGMFTLGVLVSCWVLSGLLIVLKALGRQAGWGFQFQSPAFLVALCLVLFVFALNLWGLFEISLFFPWAAAYINQRYGYSKAFFSGVLAVVLATPCTVPFMGTAIGFAVTQSAPVTLLVFTLLGLGVAFPFLVLSAYPRLLKFVPRPGHWMRTFRKFLALLLLGTVIWLVWILSYLVEASTLGTLAAGLWLIASGVWLWARALDLPVPLRGTCSAGRQKRGQRIFAVIFVVVGVAAPFKAIVMKEGPLPAREEARPDASSIGWIEYSPQRVQESLDQGRPVFIDFTARWCVNCQVNERVTLRHEKVAAKFRELGIVAVKADWTRFDGRISAALAGFGKNSIPLYVLYYGDPAKTVKVLPEIITPDIVLKALDEMVQYRTAVR
ncbi:MAG: thioredoxin family protein [Candidatus Omnitrophica bacterium]|nr:thioredoxin family protein [Candidatus Omnitrophota bacterium]